jgi:phosphomannomutase
LANTVMKLALTMLFGTAGFRTIAGGALTLMLVALAGALICCSVGGV